MAAQIHQCDVDAEPLHRYQPGGYHPIALGDTLQNGRYKILHKLGWGGYSTTWAAKDNETTRHVAVKIAVSSIDHHRELEVLQAMSAFPSDQPGRSYVNQMLDHFTLVGPNGTHKCLILEMLGPSVADIVDSYCQDSRLPAALSRTFAFQAFQALKFLAHHDIVHGDVHTGNLALAIPGMATWDDDHLLEKLGRPQIGTVNRVDGQLIANNVPCHIVRPARMRQEDILGTHPLVKIIDFGEAFFENNPPPTLHTPLAVRAPEVIFGDILDRRVDLWSAGCLLFELVTGQPPFDTFMLTPPLLVQQMMAFDLSGLPLRWHKKWKIMEKDVPIGKDQFFTLQEWLNEVYFDQDRYSEFTTKDIEQVSELISRLLKFEPSQRATATDILDSSWFKSI